jgi:hypothetical protein
MISAMSARPIDWPSPGAVAIYRGGEQVDVTKRSAARANARDCGAWPRLKLVAGVPRASPAPPSHRGGGNEALPRRGYRRQQH